MDLREWVRRRGGIVHRSDILDTGVSTRALRATVDCGAVERVRRYWVATLDAPPLLRTAAEATARVACLSAARLRGWWMPPDVDAGIHLHVRPHAAVPHADAVVHWSTPLAPVSRRTLVESVADTLEHIAGCATREAALVLWDSAMTNERWDREVLARVRWRSPAARDVAEQMTGRSDSGLETITVVRLRPFGLDLRQQVVLCGHPVDVLIGDRLVLQLDGFAHHSSSADRTRDLAHDRELVSRGYTVLRFSYVEVLYRWAVVEAAVLRAVAQGAHLAA